MRTHTDSDTQKSQKNWINFRLAFPLITLWGYISTIDKNQKIGRRRNNLCGFRIPADKVFMIASF